VKEDETEESGEKEPSEADGTGATAAPWMERSDGHGTAEAQRDGLAEIARFAMDELDRAKDTIRREGFVFDGSGGHWEKLAFSFYTDLAETHYRAQSALDAIAEESAEGA